MTNSQRRKNCLNNLLFVCASSGMRHMGIGKVLEVNNNFMSCLLKYPAVMQQYPQIEGSIEADAIFMLNLINALKVSFHDVGTQSASNPDPHRIIVLSRAMTGWKGRIIQRFLESFVVVNPADVEECLQRVRKVCVPHLQQRIRDNRNILNLLFSNQDLLDAFPWVEGWITDKEIFFNDLAYALKDFVSIDFVSLPTWEGINYSEVLVRVRKTPANNCNADWNVHNTSYNKFLGDSI